MTVQAAQFVWLALFAYAALGALVAAGLLLGGLRRVDATAAKAPWHVKLLLLPGLIALWPIMLRRFLGWRPEEDWP